MAMCLRRRRRELELSREAAAVQMDTSQDTVRKWENGRSPQVGSYPKIIQFLGREPWTEPTSLPEQLRAARWRRGLTIDQAATVLGVDASTMWWWEAGRKPHRREHRAHIARFVMVPSVQEPNASAIGIEDVPCARPRLGQLLGDRRRELGLTLEAAAERIGANPWTLLYWEHDRHVPTDRFYPALIRFLGREPWPEPVDVAEHLRAERLRRGLSQQQAAAVMQVGRDSVANWEAGRAPRHRLAKAKIEAFLTGGTRPIRQARRRG